MGGLSINLEEAVIEHNTYQLSHKAMQPCGQEKGRPDRMGGAFEAVNLTGEPSRWQRQRRRLRKALQPLYTGAESASQEILARKGGKLYTVHAPP